MSGIFRMRPHLERCLRISGWLRDVAHNQERQGFALLLMKAFELKNQAAHAKRTSTALTQLSKRLTLTDVDRKVLQRAAVILSSTGSKVKSEAATARRKEAEQEKAIAAATIEVKKLFATWPSETVLDKTAIICASLFGEDSLRKYLGEKDGRELEWYLNATFDMSIKDIVEDAAYHAVKNDKSAAAVMESARQRLDKIRAKPNVLDLAKQWQAKTS